MDIIIHCSLFSQNAFTVVAQFCNYVLYKIAVINYRFMVHVTYDHDDSEVEMFHSPILVFLVLCYPPFPLDVHTTTAT